MYLLARVHTTIYKVLLTNSISKKEQVKIYNISQCIKHYKNMQLFQLFHYLLPTIALITTPNTINTPIPPITATVIIPQPGITNCGPTSSPP